MALGAKQFMAALPWTLLVIFHLRALPLTRPRHRLLDVGVFRLPSCLADGHQMSLPGISPLHPVWLVWRVALLNVAVVRMEHCSFFKITSSI